ncbi:MAG: RsmE family RNA methyltransferase, partial [Lachnospiraceae bacterium]|nr:RsmE family RNA methyltransferase [Lachnospiraceae bacterium]
AVEYAKDFDVKLIPYEMAEKMSHTRDVISKIKQGESVGIIIGPEGGISEKEIQLAGENGFESVTLGKRILRTETAGMTVLSILMYHLERE